MDNWKTNSRIAADHRLAAYVLRGESRKYFDNIERLPRANTATIDTWRDLARSFAWIATKFDMEATFLITADVKSSCPF